MSQKNAHIIILDGITGSGRKTLSFELGLVLLYNNQKTALLLNNDSPLHEYFKQRRANYPNLPAPDIINRQDFMQKITTYDAIIIPETDFTDSLSLKASTYITLLKNDTHTIKSFFNDKPYFNNLWELKKKIAQKNKHSLNWIICENNLKNTNVTKENQTIKNLSKLYGFRLSPQLNYRKTYQENNKGLSAQDKIAPQLYKSMTYEDICAKREIEKLAEFIFNV